MGFSGRMFTQIFSCAQTTFCQRHHCPEVGRCRTFDMVPYWTHIRALPSGRTDCPILKTYGFPDLHCSLSGESPLAPPGVPTWQPAVWWRTTWSRQAASHFGHLYTQLSSSPAVLAWPCALTSDSHPDFCSPLLPWLRVLMSLYLWRLF